MKKSYFVFLLFVCFASNSFLSSSLRANRNTMPQLSPTTHVLTFEEAIRIGYENRPSLKALKYATKASHITAFDQLSGYFPQITASQTFVDDRDSSEAKHTFDIVGTQLIYSFAGPIDLYRIAKKDAEIAKIAENLHKDIIRFEIESTFLNLWIVQQQRKTIDWLEKSSASTFAKEKHQKQINLLGKNDWLKAGSTYTTNLATAHLYIDDLEIAQKRLERALGTSLSKHILVDGVAPKSTLQLAWDYNQKIHLKALPHYYKLALANRKELKVKDKEIGKEERTREFHQKSYLPSLSFFTSFSRSKLRNSSASFGRRVGVHLDWTIFDGLSHIHKHRISTATIFKFKMEKSDLKQFIRLEVETAYFELQSLFKRMAAQHTTLLQAKNELELRMQQYDIGDISKVELATAQFNWEKARFAWLELKVANILKQRELFFACGYPISLATPV